MTETGINNRFTEQLAKKESEDKKRYKQFEVAEGAGVSSPTISRWMNDSPEIQKTTLETLIKLCVYLNCQLSDLVQLDLNVLKAALAKVTGERA